MVPPNNKVAKNNPILCSFKSTSSNITKHGYYTNARYKLGGIEASNPHLFGGGLASYRFAKFRGNRFDGSIVKAFPQRHA
tara:strand:- start:16 stop:255 length:240 start_codon:yes stop_codon:yes gene_type:complete